MFEICKFYAHCLALPYFALLCLAMPCLALIVIVNGRAQKNRSRSSGGVIDNTQIFKPLAAARARTNLCTSAVDKLELRPSTSHLIEPLAILSFSPNCLVIAIDANTFESFLG